MNQTTAKITDRLWGLPQVRDFVKDAKGSLGASGWEFISPQMREGVIARKFAHVLIGNARHDIPGAAIHRLYADMLQAAGLND